jgi:hypothetical protein
MHGRSVQQSHASAHGAKYQISGMKNQSLTGCPGDFIFLGRTKIKLASPFGRW